MSRNKIFLFLLFIITLFFIRTYENNNDFPESVKVSLRDVGNKLLLSNQDSTSLVLPIILEKSKYEISFKNQLKIEPKSLVTIIENNFQKANFPTHYLVEVKECSNQEVAYSYEMISNRDSSIIPCFGRVIPKNCYTIEVKFTNKKSFFGNKIILDILAFSIFILLYIFLYKRKNNNTVEEKQLAYNIIGSFKFYSEQNKLVKEDIEISLSKKECELLAIFVANPNQIIKREIFTKKVWEDQGVIVGRSLDTYISKLRKKLKDDNSIKITNVHGVGYKLEINY